MPRRLGASRNHVSEPKPAFNCIQHMGHFTLASRSSESITVRRSQVNILTLCTKRGLEELPSFVATMSVIPYIYVWEVHSEYVPDLVDLKTFPYAKSVGRVCPGQNAIMSPLLHTGPM